MGDAEIFLHHRAGAADLIADSSAAIGCEQAVQRVLDQVALRFAARRSASRQRPERSTAAARGGDDFGGLEDSIHGRPFDDALSADVTARKPAVSRRRRRRSRPAMAAFATETAAGTQPLPARN